MLSSYDPPKNQFDELLGPDGLRPHWQELYSHLQGLGSDELSQRQHALEQAIRADGITYNVYADPQGADRPWALDMVPLVLSADDWRQIERGLVQRATLLNRVLADLYGPQKLLLEGRLPTALIQGRNGYLRPSHGLRPPNDVFLHLYAADLARSPDGRWWVIADRTQAPSGMGYALENRIIVSRLFPDVFHSQHVQRLAAFFRVLQQSLADWAPVEHGETPKVVMLTPGPYNETYFEHAYLARYLGFTLVEGQDLTVRHDRVYLKTLQGLKRVHVILRRQDDAFCDPLELRSDSALGVPGLARAQRLGHVLIANALGSGVLECGALMGYFPSLCQYLLGEELLLPSVATWWCGEDAARADVGEELSRLVLKPVAGGGVTVFGDKLNPEELDAWRARLEAEADSWYAQELVHLSQAPRWNQHRLAPSLVGLRVFLVASPNGYVAMPGGLARISDESSSRILSMQRGGSSKDTWVLGDSDSSDTLWQTALPWPELVRRRSEVACRTAESLFWLGRYCERTEFICRALRALLARLPHADVSSSSAVGMLASQLHGLGVLARARLPALGHPSLGEQSHPNHPASLLGAVFRSGSSVRERLSADYWRTLLELPRHSRAWAKGSGLATILRRIDHVMQAMATLAGLEMENITRDAGWWLLRIGRRIERLYWSGYFGGKLFADPMATGTDALDLHLELFDSQITYRSRTMSAPHWLGVLDLIALDPTNPRSIAFQQVSLQGALPNLPQFELLPAPAALAAELDILTAALAAGEMPDCAALSRVAQDYANQLGEALYAHCFTLAQETVVMPYA